MDDLLALLAFAGLRAAQLVAVLAVHQMKQADATSVAELDGALGGSAGRASAPPDQATGHLRRLGRALAHFASRFGANLDAEAAAIDITRLRASRHGGRPDIGRPFLGALWRTIRGSRRPQAAIRHHALVDTASGPVDGASTVNARGSTV
jgi:hypothetical protein